MPAVRRRSRQAIIFDRLFTCVGQALIIQDTIESSSHVIMWGVFLYPFFVSIFKGDFF